MSGLRHYAIVAAWLCSVLVAQAALANSPPSDVDVADDTPLVWCYADIREALPFQMPASPKLIERHPPAPHQCGLLEDYVCGGIERQDPTMFTVAEGMLAYGWQNPRAAGFWSIPTCSERIQWLREHKSERDWLYHEFNPVRNVVDLWWWVLNNQTVDASSLHELFNLSVWGGALVSPEKEHTDELLDMFTSPITGKLIEVKCAKFSPGNMYIDFFPSDVVARYRDEVFAKFWEPHVRPEPEGVVYMYYRVYGTTGVIRSGIFFGVPNQQGLLMGRS